MDRMKSFLFAVLFTTVIGMTAACGRNNGTANHTTENRIPETSVEETSSETEITTTMYHEETGGVLRDMVDDVEQGVDRMTE